MAVPGYSQMEKVDEHDGSIHSARLLAGPPATLSMNAAIDRILKKSLVGDLYRRRRAFGLH